MPTVQELYELWAADSDLRDELDRSLDPRGLDSLFDAFAALGPKPDDVVVDVGARNGKHLLRLMREHGVRGIAIDPVPLHADLAREEATKAGVDLEVITGAAEALPLADASVDWIWCRDVLVHVDVERGLQEFARVLKTGGSVLAYVTLPTETLEPREARALTSATALTGVDAQRLERAAESAGLVQRSVDRLGAEWRERMLEDATWDARADLLNIARLLRRREEFVERYGEAAVEAAWGGLVWGVYQILGKLCPTVYVWDRRA
jgi:ubiquinone/menaquinone biosynthesis C-methylase UbiE